MQSEFNHIDNFFQEKNREVQPDTSGMDAGWNEMKKLLQAEAATLPQSSTILPMKRYRRWLPQAAAAILFIMAVFVLVPMFTKNKRTSLPVSKSSVNPQPGKPNKPVDQNIAVITTAPKINTIKIEEPNKTNSQLLEKNFTYNLVTDHTPVINSNAVGLVEKKNNPVKEDKLVFEEFYSTLEKPAEEFLINNSLDTLIRCQEGTTVFIPAGSFQTLTGLAITGLVSLKVREFYSFADMVSNKLSTSSGGKRLETGGMINIDAVSGNQPIQVKNGSFLELKMPTQTFDPTMQLFVGEKTDGINWIPAGQEQFFPNEQKREITILNLTDNPYLVRNYKNGTRTMAKFSIPYDSPLSVDEVKRHLEKKFGRYYDKIKVSREWGPMFGKKRNDTIVTTLPWYDSKQVGDSITLPLSIAMRLKMVSWQDSIYYETLWRKQYEDAVKQKQAWSEYVQKREAYSFRISNLGWINCDRFVEYPKGRLTDFVLNPGEGFEGGTFNAILILENERSAMQGFWSDGKIRFPSLPLGHRVNIVCAGVKNGVMYTVVQQATITRSEIDDLEFEASSPEEFREKLLPFGDVTKPN